MSFVVFTCVVPVLIMGSLSHKQLWEAIDALALDNGLTASGLAKAAGLDPTAFNKSKRVTPSGRARWPSTESLAKILDATGASLDEFFRLVDSSEAPGRLRGFAALRPPQHIPVIGLAQAGAAGFFDDGGFPVGGGWDDVVFPDVNDDNAYALEISGDSMLPVYRDGDIVVVSPDAVLRRGDRVVAKTRGGEVMAKILKRKSAQRVVLGSLNPAYDDRELALADIDWIARIVWASQ